MESNSYYNYSNQPSYYASDSYYYDSMNKREMKAANKSEGNALDSNSSPPSRTRWANPISRQEINLFYSQYKDFIDSAKRYQENVLGYKPEVEIQQHRR